MDWLPELRDGRKRIFLCRHGETELNAEMRLQGGGIDSKLTETGRNQAKMLAEALAPFDIELVVTSTLQRSVDTAKHLIADLVDSKKAKLEQLQGFNELHCGSLEGKPLAEIREVLIEVSRAWKLGKLNTKVGDAESPSELIQRAEKAMHTILNTESKQCVIIAHSNFNRIYLSHIMDSKRNIFSIKQDNACINILEYDTKKKHLEIVRTNIVEHLSKKQSSL